MNYKHLLLLVLALSISVLAQKDEKKDLVIEDDGTEEVRDTPKHFDIKSDLDLPQFAGAKFIEDITAEEFEFKTKDTGSLQNIIFFGAEWCPHCKTFGPEFNILAH
jgi:thiol-disulfide isomerase/thioredoxin